LSRIRIACRGALVVGALASTGVLAGVSTGASRSRPDPRAGKIANSMRQLFRGSSLNSMVYGVWINGRPLVTGALGSALTGVPATQNMHFRVGNVTESIDGTLLLRYVDQRKVSLNAPVSRWFPRLANARRVTLRMLATNTSGYQDYVTTKSFIDGFAANPYRQYSTMAMIRLGTDLPLLFTPGKSWAFSDTNYLLLGVILGKIARKPLATALQQQIFGPLGMTQTKMPSNANAYMPPPVMHAYTNERGPYEDSTFWTPSPFATNGSVYSTLSNLGKWATALGTGSRLSRASHKLQVGPSNVGLGPLRANKYYGFGEIVSNRWIIVNPQVYGYNGDVSYFPTKKIAVVVFCTYGPKSVISEQNGTAALLRIARMLTPRSIPALSSAGRVS
jgi:D-alanyl-D-alanine carboxypeptidase